MKDHREIFQNQSPPDMAEWKRIVATYQKPSAPRALWQIVNTLVPYALLWLLMYCSLAVSWWITIPLAILAGAFLVRVFMYKRSDGVWYLSVPLAPGRHEYCFVADGVWQDDPAAHNKGLPTPWVVRIVRKL